MRQSRLNRLAAWLLFGLAMTAAGFLLFLAQRSFYRAAYPMAYSEPVTRHSARSDLPPALVYAIIRTESGFNPLAQSSVPARGLMQITQDTFEWAQLRIGEELPLHYDDLFDSDLNIRYGTAIVRLLLDQYENESNALCAYHAGWGKAGEWLADPLCAPDGHTITYIPYEDTRKYVEKVLRTKRTYEALYGLA